MPVLTRLAHTLLDEGVSPDTLADDLKWRAAKHQIPYDGTSATKAADSALYQRQSRVDQTAPATFGNNPVDAAEWLLRALLEDRAPVVVTDLTRAVMDAATAQWPTAEKFRSDVVQLAWQQLNDGLPLWPGVFVVGHGRVALAERTNR